MSATLAALAGALAGVVVARIWDYVDYVRESKRALDLTALGCRDRLAKIGHAVDALPPETRQRASEVGWRQALEELDPADWRRTTIRDELLNLGSSLDAYLAAMAPIRSRDVRQRHLELYGRLTEILITWELAPAEEVVAELDRALEQEGWISRSRAPERRAD
jgi:hypothetical protein